MSEPLNETGQVDQGGSGGEINWGDTPAEVVTPAATPEPVAAAETPAEPVPSETPAPPAEPPPTPPPSDFSIATLENGEREIRLESGQVYRGKDDGELLAKMAKAQFEASRTIRELRQPPAPPQPPPPQQAQTPFIDPTAQAIADMIAPMFGVQSGQELVARWQEMNQQIQGFQPIAQQTHLNAVAADFFRQAPDFSITPRNSELLGETMDKLGLPLTVDNMKFAHYALKGQGLYESPTPPSPPTPRSPTGQFAPRMPLPPSPSTPTPPPSTPDVWAMSDEDFLKSFA
jgi:hypothetical protein